MEQNARREFLLRSLLKERGAEDAAIPQETERQKAMLRALLNLRPPMPASEEFLSVQDAYLKEEIRAKGVTDTDDLPFVQEGIKLWRGDITTLRCGAIVNAANSGMTGCYIPLHGCIDNAIHTFAGVQLRLHCREIMERQGHDDPPGGAKITPAYNLPSRAILHTVGPAVNGKVTESHIRALASCYRSCLSLATVHGIRSVAFCCLSTGEFHFPHELAASVAVQEVRRARGEIEVIFNVFRSDDETVYRRLLSGREGAL